MKCFFYFKIGPQAFLFSESDIRHCWCEHCSFI
jgi:hypothetical protein